ncbi:hypothetical protein FisN_3Lh502 [Fistulifera solaris]|uniref:DUF3598 domain-containing protein n=1 Tax=Fistulifera solaris TaxID=1519565 RepID=A0A1Z5J957_FISSO|nr:hypothetical protein FisN_3Lh502 [Fistulifera solaris]|eukprot:GAX10301.1 hypothetical protein FisN_3Lh502 [Fistulifera solaris]
MKLHFLLFTAWLIHGNQSFITPCWTRPSPRSSSSLTSSKGEPDDPDLQWNLYKQYHARGSWKGIWTTYDYMGDVLDEVVASVDLDLLSDENKVQQTHQIVVGATRSDCATCFDRMETQTIPVAQYTRDNLMVRHRLAAHSQIVGPTLTRSGLLATELILSYEDARVRVLFQHAPVWERDIEPGSCPPQGLKLARCLISREALRNVPPTAETETETDNIRFYRPVPPYAWHKQWQGTSWTWGPQNGNRGWTIDELPEGDDWHGSAPVDRWNLRLPGGVFVQCPRILTDAEVGLCRLAWLAKDETLLRVEAGVTVLQPIVQDEQIVGFEPPALTSLRCDILQKVGDLEGEPMFLRENAANSDGVIAPTPESAAEESSDALKAIRDAMSL